MSVSVAVGASAAVEEVPRRQLQKISIGESVQPDIHAVSWPMWHVVQVHQL